MSSSIISLDRARRARRVRGAKAQAVGATFEKMFFNLAQAQGFCITRIADGCKQISATQLVRVKTPFDWIMTYQGKTALIDTKTTQGARFSASQIQPHQMNEMAHHELNGGIAGYVVWLRETDQVLFLNSSMLEFLAMHQASISQDEPDESVLLGSSRQMDFARIFLSRAQEEPHGSRHPRKAPRRPTHST